MRLRDDAGRLRIGWRLAFALGGCALLTAAVPLGLGAAFGALFQAWNLRPDTVSRAPGWARMVYAWHGSAVTLATHALAILLCLRLSPDRLESPRGKRACAAWLAGTGLAILSAALFLLTDSLRLRWPLSAPRLTGALPVLWLMSGAGVLAEELLTKRVVYDAVEARRGTIPATVCATAISFLFGGGLAGNVLSGVNVALMGISCCLLYRAFGLWVPVAFRWAWSFHTLFLLGQGGGDHAVYRLYAVSENLLTGGDRGFVYGLWLTVVLVVAVLGMARLLWKRERH